MSASSLELGGPVALITGATGFVGGHLIAELRANTVWQAVGLARSGSDFVGEARILRCDLLDPVAVQRVIEQYRPEYVFHLAAQSYVPKAMASPADTLQNNILGQVHLFEAIKASGIDPTVIVVSSGEVYGAVQDSNVAIHENLPLLPRNPYAVSKATQDLIAYQYFVSDGLKTVRVRPFNHVGPGQDDRFVIGSFARQVIEVERGRIEPTILTGNLDVERDFLDVRDVVRAYRMLAEAAPAGEVFNVASGRPRRIGDLLDMLIAIAGVDVRVERDPARVRPGEVWKIVGDRSRLQRQTGWCPEIEIEQTLADALDWWRSQLR